MATTKAHIRATQKYEKENYFKTLVRFKKEDEQRIRNAAESGSLNGFITGAVLEKLDRIEQKPIKEKEFTTNPTQAQIEEFNRLVEEKRKERELSRNQ